MATTEIHAISSTPNLALNYSLSDKVVEINDESEINRLAPHKVFEENGKLYVRYLTLTSYSNCNSNNPYSSFEDKQLKWQNAKYKNEGSKAKNGKEPLMYHLVQSFNGFEVPFAVANEIGRKLAEEVFKGFTVTVSTHGNTDNFHNHFNISAWNEDGKKWNKCNTTYRQIRKVSDRLCEEYGLSVLDKTREMSLIRYRDNEGKLHFYEPTERKNAMIAQRSAGEISADDVNSFRNTASYAELKEKVVDNRAEIKNDIDILLPSCNSYEELLSRLRELGYSINDKKKNGDWLQHISFKSPTQNKATRDDKIGNGEFYVRENLEKYFADKLRERSQPIAEERNRRDYDSDASEYEYGMTDIANIDVEYRVAIINGERQRVRRSDCEKNVLNDIIKTDGMVRGLVDTSQLHKIIEEQRACKKQGKPYRQETQEQRLVAQIQNSFRCLQYTEAHNIYSYEQIIDLYTSCKSKYDATIDNFEKAEKAIAQLKDVLNIPRLLTELREKMEANKNNVEYIIEEYSSDKRTSESMEKMMSKFKIDTEQGRADLSRKVSEFETAQNRNREYMKTIVFQMTELENCIRTFDRIDSAHGARNTEAMKRFDGIVMRGSAASDVNRAKEQRSTKDNR